jgi:hypothetical protein
MTQQIEIYEMDYSVSPGGINCWEATIRGYGESSTISDFKSAGEALNYVLDRYPSEMINCSVMSLQTYEKAMNSYAD